MGLKISPQQSRKDSARLDLLRQELYAPLLSIEGYTELLKEQIADEDCLSDLAKIKSAAGETRRLFEAMLEAETQQLDRDQRDSQRSSFKHDLRNSVGAISGYSEIILEELEDADELGDETRTYLEQQLADSSSLLQILDTLFVAEREFGDETEKSLNVDINSVFESFARSDRESAKRIHGNILVVDDNESNRKLLAHQLNRQGHEVNTAASGRAALDMVRANVPDLMLLDLFMPDMNGFDVLQEMHADEDLRAVPVIIITGLNDKNAAVKCIEAGAFDLLIKPVNPALLDARVVACLERKAWHDKEREYQQELEKSYTFIRKVFGRYLSDEVVQQILESDDGMQMGGGKQTVTIMMTDIRGFSMLSQALDPQDCVRMLNNYFGVMTPLIQKHDGVIDEFLGDAILAIFGAPVFSETHAQQAVACAIEMQKAMDEVNETNRKWGLPGIEMGIAVNTGEVVVGNIGSETRSKYGVVGHHVNLTARIESFTVGGQVMISEFTLAQLDSKVEIAQSMKVEAKGIKDPVRIHEITGIGAPYELYLPRAEQAVRTLREEIPVSYKRLSGKAIADKSASGYLVAAADGVAQLATDEELEVLTNLRMHVPGYPGAEDDQIFSKVTALASTQNGQNHYIIKLTSATVEARKYIDSMIEQT
ncbi:MAG: response regulator [Xanthomonadales bacterium]|nr:response regulator [Xanthomonadales bacterium]